MPIFVKLTKEDRIRLFKEAKKNLNGPWNKVYPQFNISKSMFFNYLSGKYDIPQDIFLNLKKIAKFNISNYKQFNKNKFIKKEIKNPIMDSHLAEILGVLNGDGYISDIKYEISVVLSSYEKNYALYLKNMFEKKFKTHFNLIIQPGKIRLKTYSTDIFKILTSNYNLPNGKKKGKLAIPKQVFTNRIWLISYLRGLFDTDGSFYIRRKKDPVIEISSADKRFLNEVKDTLIHLGFNTSIGTNKISIYRKEDIIKFFNLIKPANSKHLKKHQSYFNLGAGSIMASISAFQA